MYTYLKILLPIITLLLLGCQKELVNLSAAKAEVDKYYKEGFYGKETYDVIDEALAEVTELNFPSNPAAVFDVDETVLSNYEHIKEVDFGYAKPMWHDWLLSAKAKSIPQTKKLYDYFIDNNISVIFLTARPESVYDATYKNLKTQGYSTFDTLICKNGEEQKLSSAHFKQIQRNRLEANGYNIIATIGDQWSDLEGEHTGIKVKIPNYIYEIK